MPWYEYRGEKIEAKTPESAKALIRNRQEGGEVTGTTGESDMSNFLAGIGSGMVNVGRQVGNMVGLVDDEEIAQQAVTDEALLATKAGTGGRLAGEIAATLPLGMGAGSGALRGMTALKGAQSTARVLPAAVEGLTEGAILAGPDDRLLGAATGAGIGGGLTQAAKIARRVAAGPADIAPGARMLMEEGVDLTPGRVKPGGWMSAAEESAPGRFAPNVSKARQQNIDDTVRVMMRRSAPSGEAKDAIKMGGGSLLDDMDTLYKSFDEAYAPVHGISVMPALPDGTDLGVALMRTANNAPLDDMARQRISRFVHNEMTGLKNSTRGAMKSDDLLALRSRIRSEVRDMQRSASTAPREVAAMESVERQITEVIESQLPPDVVAKLRHADMQYAKTKTVEDVLSKRGDKDMTRDAITTGIQKAEERMGGKKGLVTGADATGFRDISQAAQTHLVEKTPATGAALALPLMGAAAGTAIAPGYGTVVGMGLPAAMSALGSGTKFGRRRLTGQGLGQQRLSRTLEKRRRELENLGAVGRAGAVAEYEKDY